MEIGTKSRGTFSPKRAKIDHEVNRWSKQSTFALLLLAICVAVVNGENNFKSYLRYFLIIACVLPIGLRINLDMSKMYFSFLIKNDKDVHMA